MIGVKFLPPPPPPPVEMTEFGVLLRIEKLLERIVELLEWEREARMDL